MQKNKARHAVSRTKRTPAHKTGGFARKQLTQARAEETRARILQAARNVFAEHGLDGISVRDIAQAANTTHSMITYHFGSKEQLWREAVRDMFEHLEQSVLAAGEQQGEQALPVRERFEQLVRRYVRYCAAHPEHARITFAETIRGGERLEWMVREFVKRNHRNVLPVFEQLVAEGVVPSMPAPSFLYALVGMTQLPFVLAKEAVLAFNYNMMSEQAIERHADAVIALILRNTKTTRAGKAKARKK